MSSRFLVSTLAAAILAALAGPLVPAAALSTEAQTSPAQTATRLREVDGTVAEALSELQQLQQSQPTTLIATLDKPIHLARTERLLHDAVREEQTDIYLLAGDPATEREVEARLPSPLDAQVRDLSAALRAIWRLAEVTDITDIHPHFVRDYADSLPIATLVGDYQGAAGLYGMDWTYLAAINYVETDFGRVLGPSVTGAEGPMQFEPATWSAYGTGSVMSPSDSIDAAAKYLSANGAPTTMAQAVYAYNPAWDYVEGVTRYAAVIRRDPTWYTRLYYWSTAEPGK
ncbi:MAG TPA: transglycosylase SLT domain-containing protein [Candidatus Dormibacteraeota bacterium]